jgi:hypothetical protein
MTEATKTRILVVMCAVLVFSTYQRIAQERTITRQANTIAKQAGALADLTLADQRLKISSESLRVAVEDLERTCLPPEGHANEQH